MSGFFIGGLADGFMQGFNAVEQWRANRDERARQKQLDEENRATRAQTLDMQKQQMGLAQAQLGLQQQKQAADEAESKARLDLLNKNFGLSSAQLGLQQQKQAADIADSRQRLGLLSKESDRQDQQQWYANQEADLKIREAQRQERLRKAQTEIYPKMQAGTLTAEDAQKWKEATGLDLRDVTNDGFVDEALGVFHGLKTGQIKLDDPRIEPIADKLYGHYLQRGIGERMTPTDADGKPLGPEITVTGKRWGGAYQAPDGRWGVNVIVTGKDAAGNERVYQSQATRYGTGDPNDPVMTFSGEDFERPLVAAMYMNHAFNGDPKLKANIERVLGMGGGGKDEKTAAEVEALRAKAALYRNQAQGAGDTDKRHEAKMQDVRALANQRYGGKLNMLTDTEIGADRNGWDAVIEGADQLLRKYPEISSAEAFGLASRNYLANKGNAPSTPDAKGKQDGPKEGQVYEDANGNRAIYRNGKFEKVQ